MSLDWWDRHFSWKRHKCLVLCDEDNRHLCYVFFNIDRYRMYMTIHNIFTPLVTRRHGYAHELLNEIFEIALEKRVRRFKLTSISTSLDFYLSLGFVYWGVNSVGDYYCDLPVPQNGLGALLSMTSVTDIHTLIDGNISKINGNELNLSDTQMQIYEKDKIKMGKHYLHSAFLAKQQGG
ncbi:MAG TPA: N-acetyltransferase [Epsilonproteobacteria bacterium]|nr:N-acetyltransferase [Campylobacterota bacterium]